MNSKSLNDYFNRLTQIENKTNEWKKYLISLRIQIEENEKKLSELRHELKTIEYKIESKSSQIPQTISEVIAIESENKSLCYQIQCFETKISDLKQKMFEMNCNQKQKINEFVEHSFGFSQKYGIRGHIRTQIDFLNISVKSLQIKRNELRDKMDVLDEKQMESILNENNFLNDKISEMTVKKNLINTENFELKCIENSLNTKLKQIESNANNCQELLDLQKQLKTFENIKNKNNYSKSVESTVKSTHHSEPALLSKPSLPSKPILCSKTKNNFEFVSQKLNFRIKSEPQVIEISDSNDESQENSNNWSQTTGQLSQKYSNQIQKNKTIIKIEPKSVEEFWGLIRERKLQNIDQ